MNLKMPTIELDINFQYFTIGSLSFHELMSSDKDLPSLVSIQCNNV